MPGGPFLTITQVAAHFGVPAWKVRRLVDSLDIEIPRAGLYRLVPRETLARIGDELGRRRQLEAKAGKS